MIKNILTFSLLNNKFADYSRLAVSIISAIKPLFSKRNEYEKI
jgi:hypothetical protein